MFNWTKYDTKIVADKNFLRSKDIQLSARDAFME
jgi:hypothetical protein